MSAAGRREQVGDAGIRLVARDGIRALTHLRVDAEADLPRGSTSYYARTRHDLLRLVVNRLFLRGVALLGHVLSVNGACRFLRVL